MTIDFAEAVRRNRRDEGFALASVCSAHPDVLTASLRLAHDMGASIAVEATSNQVNQDGGYTGMRPADFVAMVTRSANEVGLDTDRIILGGDHLGPQAWKREPAAVAMDRAATMMRAYVEAGFRKIHLDCSEGCGGEPAQVGDEIAADRAAELAAVCEATSGGGTELSYVIGTEVPPPGGARVEEQVPHRPTRPEAATRTLRAHEEAFSRRGLQDAWTRVRGLVVQPGLEFSAAHVDRFDASAPDALSAVLGPYPTMAFEAHSTDYQEAAVFGELARRHFAVLKVGPALAFAYREAVYALSGMDGWLNGYPHVSDVMERLMLENPEPWERHYEGGASDLRLLRHFGYADRIRYYWGHAEAMRTVAALEDRLNGASVPAALLAQYVQSADIERAAQLEARGLSFSKALIHAHIETALRPYLELAR